MDVTALGELLVDFTYNGQSSQDNGIYEANPGGAPCNVLAMLQKLGRHTAFIGKVGRDSFGRMLSDTIKAQGICTDGIRYDEKIPTTLAFVHTATDGDRSFSFYRSPGADLMLRKEELEIPLIEQAKIFHFGSLSMTDTSIDETTQYAVSKAKKAGTMISFDPNLRPPLWNNLSTAREKISYGFHQCDILKISDDEITFMTGETDVNKGVEQIIDKYQIPFVCATMGKKGSRAFFNGKIVDGKPYPNKHTIETTGAGDTFCACMLDFILQEGIPTVDEDKVKSMLAFANAAASLITTKKGALKVMPERNEIMQLAATL